MSKIAILSEDQANKIAAGEVVERPASVVKELLENAIDAGAHEITVEVEGGGVRMIRVVDDGVGMDEEDLLLCLERHATSKIREMEQLSTIQTLGFRGEALPSIASVAQITLTSRQEGRDLGTRVEVDFGRKVKVHEMGCSRGTAIEVKNLFGNVPARRKFLKSNPTELGHIDEVIRNYALVCPAIGFTFTVDGREVMRLTGQRDTQEERVKKLIGPRLKKPLINISQNSQAISVAGYLLPPGETLPGFFKKMRFFINGRPIKAAVLAHAVTQGLRGFLMKDRFPGGVLFLFVPSDSIDINVHPTKQEVRFHKPGIIHQLVVFAISRAMSRYQDDLKVELFGPPKKDELRPSAPFTSYGVEASRAIVSEPKIDYPAMHEGPSPIQMSIPLQEDLPGRPANERFSVLAPETDIDSGRIVDAPSKQAVPPLVPSLGNFWARLSIIGQILQSYILCEAPEGLIIIDQHAAHERLLYEQLNLQYAQHSIKSQVLLFPQVMELSHKERRLTEEHREEIRLLGLELSPFGGDSHIIKAVPAIMGHIAPELILSEFLNEFSFAEQDGKSSPHSTRLERILATMACKAAIKAGQSMSREEMANLLRQMEGAGTFSHCPHGRPVLKEISLAEIKRWFHRT